MVDTALTDKTIRLIKQAALALRAARGRRGAVVWLDDAEDVLVAGDLHGNLTNLQAILQLARLEEHPGRRLVLQEFVHGTGRHSNGGCDSHRLLDRVCSLVVHHPHQVFLLPGNHELAELTGRSVAKAGVPLNALFYLGIEYVHSDRTDEVVASYHELFESMPLAVRTPNRVFISHSYPSAGKLDVFDVGIFERYKVPAEQRGKGSDLYHLLWDRDTDEETAERFSKMVDADYLVTGHIAQKEGFAIPNSRQIILDCVDRPAACLLFSAREPMTSERLAEGILMLD